MTECSCPSYVTVSEFSTTVTVTLSVTGVMLSAPSTITNRTFVKLVFVFSKSAALMPTGYSPTFVPFAVHAAVSTARTLVVASYSGLLETMDT